MRLISLAPVIIATLMALTFSGGCTGVSLADNAESPKVFGADPILANKNTIVTILGDHLIDAGDVAVTIGGIPCQLLSGSNNALAVLVPENIVSGEIRVSGHAGSGTAVDPFIVGNQDYVDEAEPNDDSTGTDATLDNGNRLFRGNLSSSSDKDNLKFVFVPRTVTYLIHIEPKVVSSITVNGSVRNLDSQGNVTVGAPDVDHSFFLVGLTGGVGAYTISLSRVVH